MSLEIKLISEIQKYEFLYNYNIPSYNRKDLIDDAWKNISEKCNLTPNDCKEKWRNIRSSYLRSLKSNGHKQKKPYYLGEFLAFILPFLKPLNNVETTDDSTQDNQDIEEVNSDDFTIEMVKIEADDTDEDESNAIGDDNDSDLSSSARKRKAPSVRESRKLPRAIHKEHFLDIGERMDVMPHSSNLNSPKNALQMFLMSLLPELESMTEEQIRTFKIKALTLIDDIKSDYSRAKLNSPMKNERLQKRLINLLLKNLEKCAEDKTDDE